MVSVQPMADARVGVNNLTTTLLWQEWNTRKVSDRREQAAKTKQGVENEAAEKKKRIQGNMLSTYSNNPKTEEHDVNLTQLAVRLILRSSIQWNGLEWLLF